MSGQRIAADASPRSSTPGTVVAVVSFLTRCVGSGLEELVLRGRTRRLRRADEQDWLSPSNA